MKKTKLILSIIIVIFSLLVTSVGVKYYKEEREINALRSQAIYNAFGYNGYAYDSAGADEVDDYGRMVFRFRGYNEATFDGLIHCMICQYIDYKHNYVYYYPTDNILTYRTEAAYIFPVELVDSLKEKNDWNKEIDLSKCVKRKIDKYKDIDFNKVEIEKIFEEYILPLLKGVAEKVFTVFSNLWTEKIKPVLDIIGNGIKNTFEGVKKGLSILWEGLTKEFKTIINLLISGINLLIKGVNKISFDFPDWIPGIGGKTFGINIPEIPMLANGAVIDKPTVAMMGEYAGAKTNKEIVTPENLMRQVFVESMLPIAQIIANGNNDVVSAIEDMANRPIHLNGRKVSENIFDDMNKVAIRKTGRALSYAR